MNDNQPIKDLVKLLQTQTEFEAHAKAAVLNDAGITYSVVGFINLVKESTKLPALIERMIKVPAKNKEKYLKYFLVSA